MTLISFDLSTNTGWSVFEDGKLVEHGLIVHKVPGYISNVKVWTDIPPQYPYNFIETAKLIAESCYIIYKKYPGAKVVTEHTEGSKHRFSQRLLEFIHYAFLERFKGIDVKYLLNSDWRNVVRCYISLWPELKLWNAKVGRLKKKAPRTKAGARVAKLDGKVVSTIDRKKLSVMIVNQHFGLNLPLSEDDIADSINMGRAACELNLFNI